MMALRGVQRPPGRKEGTVGYTESTLTPDEAIVYRSRLHWSLFWGPLVWGMTIAFLTAGLGLLVVVPWWLLTCAQWASSEFVVTTDRVVLKVGVLKRRTTEMVLRRVETVSVQQGAWARLNDYGTVLLVGTGGSREAFVGIARPLAFREAVMGQLARLTASEH
jgi:uncharacterized membrane protein YdbT with pleckstrin-like domain